jgi:hypothetical protein
VLFDPSDQLVMLRRDKCIERRKHRIYLNFDLTAWIYLEQSLVRHVVLLSSDEATLLFSQGPFYVVSANSNRRKTPPATQRSNLGIVCANEMSEGRFGWCARGEACGKISTMDSPEGRSAPEAIRSSSASTSTELDGVSRAERTDAILELLKLKTAEAAALQVHIVATATLYFAIMGALFKFAFDINSTPKLRVVLASVALATSLVFCLAAILGQVYRRRLIGTLSSLRRALHLDNFPEDLPGVKYSVLLALLVAIVVIATWTFVLMKPNAA